jgi:hypothetical protein
MTEYVSFDFLPISAEPKYAGGPLNFLKVVPDGKSATPDERRSCFRHGEKESNNECTD